MAGHQRFYLEDGTPVTVGECDQKKYKDLGLWFVSIGESQNHTTFIVNPQEATVVAIKARGSDLNMWYLVAIYVPNTADDDPVR